jgi:2,4-dienoyl-CoA reductase-like NADH-dependent reductase (Old Yellow Enzyme family)
MTCPESDLASPLALPCGRTIGNRLVKAAMSEQLAGPCGEPTEALIRLYEQWASSGASVLITGNVMIDASATSEPRQVVVEDARDAALLARWARAAQAEGAAALMQINHAGRQVPRVLRSRAKAPSAISLPGPLFARAVALDDQEIHALIERFAAAATAAIQAGFAGVQIHAAHGYLISQFLSGRANKRRDVWGANAVGRRRLLTEIVRAVRAAVGPHAIVSVKLNSPSEHEATSLTGVLDTVAVLQDASIDVLEISGGNFHAAAMLGVPASQRDAVREGYFLDFATQARRLFRKPLMVTGGWRTHAAMSNALTEGAVDLFGLGRPLVLEADFARRVLHGRKEDTGPLSPMPRRPAARGLFGGLGEIAWYTVQLWRRSAGLPVDRRLGLRRAEWRYLRTQVAQKLAHRR